MSRMVKVDDFYNNGTTDASNYLEEIFTTATNLGNQVHLFSDIFYPIRDFITEEGQVVGLADTVTYYNVGLTTSELADLYWTEYSGLHLIGAGQCKTWADDKAALEKRVTSVFKKNLGKYKKLIEIFGLTWNPLWNVDGVEMHQLLESHGDEANVRTKSTRELHGSNNQKTHDTTPYNDTGYRTEWKETETGQSATTSGTVSASYGTDTYSAQVAATDVAYDIGGAEASLDKKMHEQISYSVNASDTVFGTGLSGADIMHTEKTVRQGNIGITETTKLLDDAIRFFKLNIIEEFFKDINEVILVGVYGNYDCFPNYCCYAYPSIQGASRTVTYNRVRSMTFDNEGTLINMTLKDGQHVDVYNQEDLEWLRNHQAQWQQDYPTVPIQETMMNPLI